MRWKTSLGWAALACTIAVPLSAQDIDTRSGSYTTYGFNPVGQHGYKVGQTFTLDASARLNSVSFGLWDRTDGGMYYGNAPVFQAYVLEWNDSAMRATGDILWRSGEVTIPHHHYDLHEPIHIYRRYLFADAPTVALGAGSYVAFISALGHYDSYSDQTYVGRIHNGTSDATYAGGKFVFQADGLPIVNDWGASYPWSTQTYYDADFAADFTDVVTVPEPGAWLLLGSGLLGLGFISVQRRREEELAA